MAVGALIKAWFSAYCMNLVHTRCQLSSLDIKVFVSKLSINFDI